MHAANLIFTNHKQTDVSILAAILRHQFPSCSHSAFCCPLLMFISLASLVTVPWWLHAICQSSNIQPPRLTCNATSFNLDKDRTHFDGDIAIGLRLNSYLNFLPLIFICWWNDKVVFIWGWRVFPDSESLEGWVFANIKSVVQFCKFLKSSFRFFIASVQNKDGCALKTTICINIRDSIFPFWCPSYPS